MTASFSVTVCLHPLSVSLSPFSPKLPSSIVCQLSLCLSFSRSLSFSLCQRVLAVLSRRFLANRSVAIESRIFAAFTRSLTFGRLSSSNRREIGPSGGAQTTGVFPIRPTNDEISSYRSEASDRVLRVVSPTIPSMSHATYRIGLVHSYTTTYTQLHIST